MTQVEELERKLAKSEEQRQAAEELANQRRRENEEVRAEAENVRSMLQQRQTQVRELEIRLNNLETERTAERIELHKVKQEIILVKEHSERQRQDFERSLSEARAEWDACSKRMASAEKEVSQARSERNAMDTRARMAEQEVKHLKETLDESAKEKSRLQADILASEMARDSELAACKTLRARCKDVEDEAEREKKRAIDLVAEAQKRMERAEQTVESEKRRLDEEFKRMKQHLENELQSRIVAVEAKRLDLNISHEVLSALSPTTAEEMLRNRGLTLASLYEEVVAERERARRQEDEISHLNTYLTKIVEEVEHAAPELVSSRLEYSRVLANCDVLNEKLGEMFNENKDLKEELAAKSIEAEHLKKENQELTLQASDLAAQIRTLLAQSEQNVSFSSPPRMAPSGRAQDDAQEVITHNLVQYGNVQELQERNQQLLRLVRRFAEEGEQRGDATDSEQKLKEAEDEIQRMSEARERQEAMIATIVQQRDLYRTLLHQADSKFAATSFEPSAMTGSPQRQGNAAMDAFRADFELYKSETELRIKELDTQLTDARQELHTTRMRLGQVEAERLALQERMKLGNESLETLRKDCDRLRQAEIESQSQVAHLHAVLEERRRMLDEVERTKRQVEQDRDLARAETKVLRDEVTRMSDVQKELAAQRDSQRALADRWQQAHKEAADRLSDSLSEREKLEKAEHVARAEADKARKDRDDAQVKAEVERAELAARLDEMSSKVQIARDALTRAETELEVTRRQQSVLTEQLERLPTAGGSNPASSRAAPPFGMIEELRVECESLRQRLEQRTKDVEALKTVATESDSALRLVKTALDNAQKELAEKLKIANEEKRGVERRLSEAEKALNEERARSTSLDKRVKELSESNAEVDSLKQRLIACEENGKRLQQEAAVAGENYSHELQLHAKDVANVAELRRELDRTKTDLEKRSKQLRDMEAQLSVKEAEWAAQRKATQKRTEDDKIVADELQKETRLLREQLDRATSTLGASTSIGTEEGSLKEMILIVNRSRDKLALEKEELSLELRRTTAQLAQARTDSERVREEVKRLEQQLTSSADRQRLATAMQELTVLRNLQTTRQEELERLGNELDRARGDVAAAKSSQVELLRRESEAQSKLQIAEKDIASREHELKLVRERLETVMSRIGDADLVDKLKGELGARTTEVEALKRDKERLEDMVKQLREAAKRAKAQLETELTEAKTRVEHLEREHQAASARITDLETKLASQIQLVAEKERALETKELSLTRFRKKIGEDKARIDELQARVRELESKLTQVSAAPPSAPELLPPMFTPVQPHASSPVTQPVAVVQPPPIDLMSAPVSSTPEQTVAAPATVPQERTEHDKSDDVMVMEPSGQESVENATEREEPPAGGPESGVKRARLASSSKPTSTTTPEPETQTTIDASGSLNLKSLPFKFKRRIVQELKMTSANMTDDQLLTTLEEYAKNNEGHLREVLDKLRRAKEDSAGAAQPKSVVPNKAKEKEMLAKRIEALKKTESIQPDILPPPPSEAASPAQPEPITSEEEQRKAARIARFRQQGAQPEAKKRAKPSDEEEEK